MSKDLISDGLAVSYYYNFVKRIFDNITINSKVMLDEKAYPFNYNRVSLQVIIPKELNNSDIEKCKNNVYGNNEVRLIIERGRDMIFFVKSLDSSKMKVVDFPTSLISIIEFLKLDIVNSPEFTDDDISSEKWKERGKLELAKFKEILEFLINSHENTKGRVEVNYFN